MIDSPPISARRSIFGWRRDKPGGKAAAMNPIAQRMTLLLWAELALLSAIWGGSFLFGRVAMAHLPPLTTAFARVTLAALALWLFVLATRRNTGPARPFLLALLAMGLFNNAIPFFLILWGQREIGSGLASVINALTPVWTLIFARFTVHDEPLGWGRVLGIVLGLTGVAVLMSGDIGSGLSAPLAAQLAVLGATVSYGAAAVFGRRFRQVDPVLVATGQLSASTMILFLPAMLIDSPWSLPAPPAIALWSVACLALLCTAFAYFLFFRILSRAGATNVSLVTMLVPASAILLGAIFLGETLTLAELGGMALIMIGLAAIDGRLIAFLSR